MYTGPDKVFNGEKLERILGSPFHLHVQVCKRESCVYNGIKGALNVYANRVSTMWEPASQQGRCARHEQKMRGMNKKCEP